MWRRAFLWRRQKGRRKLKHEDRESNSVKDLSENWIMYLCSGCGWLICRAVASNTRGLRFKSSCHFISGAKLPRWAFFRSERVQENALAGGLPCSRPNLPLFRLKHLSFFFAVSNYLLCPLWSHSPFFIIFYWKINWHRANSVWCLPKMEKLDYWSPVNFLLP